MAWDDYWVANGYPIPVRKIVCAANRVDDVILCGARHWDNVMRSQADKMYLSTTKAEQGFIDQFGNWYDRVEALTLVKLSGQPFHADRNGSTTKLFSEGLY